MGAQPRKDNGTAKGTLMQWNSAGWNRKARGKKINIMFSTKVRVGKQKFDIIDNRKKVNGMPRGTKKYA